GERAEGREREGGKGGGPRIGVRGPCCAPEQNGVVAPSARRRLTASAAQPLPQRFLRRRGRHAENLPDGRTIRKRTAMFSDCIRPSTGAHLPEKQDVPEVICGPARFQSKSASNGAGSDKSISATSGPHAF